MDKEARSILAMWYKDVTLVKGLLRGKDTW